MDADFLRKMKAMSIIKAELMKLGKDPDVIERILMNEFDNDEQGGVSGKMKTVDLNDPAGIAEMMEEVLKKI